MAQTGTIQDDCSILFDGNIGVGSPVIANAKACICIVATSPSGTPIRDMENTVECLEVSVAGAWGAVGDKIKHTRWYNTETGTPIFVVEEFVNQQTFAVVAGVTGANTIPCTTGSSTTKLTLAPKTRDVTTVVGQNLATLITDPRVESFSIFVRSGSLIINDGVNPQSTYFAGESVTWGQGTEDYINPGGLTFNSVADITLSWEVEP